MVKLTQTNSNKRVNEADHSATTGAAAGSPPYVVSNFLPNTANMFDSSQVNSPQSTPKNAFAAGKEDPMQKQHKS